eukprot:CAMPEP_0178574358 /NCGR_PEP_ID=MMETSP0697-20121206/19308_1 /TAXON_ID=265572 /ORGANISM="Extubocellulus spinifer, Strain CCMP396" /LENGTH=508 /DNA_ID=CAMNT_0020209337 /DNA_START=86 /DNA_END=1612 /DNA_ORIENTATION=+
MRTRSLLLSPSAPLLLLLILLSRPLLVTSSSSHSNSHPLARRVEIINESGSKMGVYWQNPNSHELVPIGDAVGDGSSFGLNSFVNHTLVLRETDDRDGGASSCNDDGNNGSAGRCRATSFIVGDNQEQHLVIKEGMKIETIDDTITDVDDLLVVGEDDGGIASLSTEASEQEGGDGFMKESKLLLSDCKARALSSIGSGTTNNLSSSDMEQVMSSLNACMKRKVTKRLMDAADEVNDESKARINLADKLENYTCADPTAQTTAPIDKRTWTHDGIERDVLIMHQRNASKIHVIKNFIKPHECDAVHAAANPLLHKATVADGKGGSEYSDSRKAMQAGLRVPWEKEEEGDGIATVSRRLYDYINQETGYNLKEPGQEDLMSIQYQGRGDDDPSPDNYRPHCDGDCSGLDHKRGGRVATMVIYCNVPEKGGSTNFRNANVHVKPELHTAVFFSYLDADTNRMDTGWTEHSGCPVREGKKSIAVQWLRVGVDEDNPWDSFNTLTVSRKDLD